MRCNSLRGLWSHTRRPAIQNTSLPGKLTPRARLVAFSNSTLLTDPRERTFMPEICRWLRSLAAISGTLKTTAVETPTPTA